MLRIRARALFGLAPTCCGTGVRRDERESKRRLDVRTANVRELMHNVY
jgi:hypothetical protein